MSALLSSSAVVLPVIHVTGIRHAVEQATLAHDAGAPGVFLINHHGSPEELGDAVLAVRAEVGGWIGANPLGLDALGVFTTFASQYPVDGIWTDNAGVVEHGPQDYAHRVDIARTSFSGLYFGGVAFKYQRPVADLTAAGREASAHMDVVCTSGPGTGMAATPSKIAALVAGSTRPVAVASGVDAGNISALFAAEAKLFLVASSINADWEHLDRDRTRELVELAATLHKDHLSNQDARSATNTSFQGDPSPSIASAITHRIHAAMSVLYR